MYTTNLATILLRGLRLERPSPGVFSTAEALARHATYPASTSPTPAAAIARRRRGRRRRDAEEDKYHRRRNAEAQDRGGEEGEIRVQLQALCDVRNRVEVAERVRAVPSTPALEDERAAKEEHGEVRQRAHSEHGGDDERCVETSDLRCELARFVTIREAYR
jgi:hypothetical protein